MLNCPICHDRASNTACKLRLTCCCSIRKKHLVSLQLYFQGNGNRYYNGMELRDQQVLRTFVRPLQFLITSNSTAAHS